MPSDECILFSSNRSNQSRQMLSFDKHLRLN